MVVVGVVVVVVVVVMVVVVVGGWLDVYLFLKILRNPLSILRLFLLFDFQEKISDQYVFTPDLLYLHYFLRKNAYLTCLVQFCLIFFIY